MAAAPAFAADEGAGRVVDGPMITDGVPPVPESIAQSLNQYQAVRAASFADWTPDGKAVLIHTRFGNTSQVHRVDQPLGMRRQLTFFEEPVASVAVRPHGAGFVYAMDEGGDEYDQLYYYDFGSAQHVLLTDGKQSLNRAPIWTDDGSKLVYMHTPEGSHRYQIKVATANDLMNARVVLDQDGAWYPVDWSDDGHKLLLARIVSAAERYVYVLDLQSSKLTEVNPGKGVISYGGGRFSEDGQSVFLTSDEGAEFQRLVRINLSSGKQTVLTPDLEWGVSGFDLSPDGKTLIYYVNEAGIESAYTLDVATGESTPLDWPKGIIGGGDFSPDGTRYAVTLNRATSPSDVYIYDFASKQLTQWTDSEVGGLNKAKFIEPKLIHYESFDGRDISAFAFKPHGPGPHPVILYIHGGPESQYVPYFSSIFQYWINELGFAVIAPNVRGSEGFGKTFLSLDNAMNRKDSVADLEALVDWVRNNPDYKADKVVVYGGSYGGYMVNAAMTTFPDKLAAGVSVVGISDFATFLQNTAEYRRDLRRVEYGDERDPVMRAEMDRLSPLQNAANITKPIFVIGGGNDPRVPVSESEQLVSAARSNDAEAWLMIAMDEGHGFAKKENRDAMYEAVALFLKTQVLDEAPAE